MVGVDCGSLWMQSTQHWISLDATWPDFDQPCSCISVSIGRHVTWFRSITFVYSSSTNSSTLNTEMIITKRGSFSTKYLHIYHYTVKLQATAARLKYQNSIKWFKFAKKNLPKAKQRSKSAAEWLLMVKWSLLIHTQNKYKWLLDSNQHANSGVSQSVSSLSVT